MSEAQPHNGNDEKKAKRFAKVFGWVAGALNAIDLRRLFGKPKVTEPLRDLPPPPESKPPEE